MSLTLVFGVLDVAYSDANGSGETTTGDVAEILEKNYGVMRTFYELRREKIAGYLADSMAGAIQDLVNGAPRRDPTYGAMQKIETEFRGFIFSGEMGRMYKAFTGQEISAAAARGVNHRKKHPYAASNPARVAFVDTGTYVASFRSWVTQDATAPQPVTT